MPSSFEIPLFQAAASGAVDRIALLLDSGAQIDQRDDSGETALWYASNEASARLLIERGLSLEDVNQYGWTPLVSHLGDPERVRMFIGLGANVNATFDRGYTVFMSAAGDLGRKVEVLRLLVSAGADPHAVSELGFNAFHAAIDVNGEANDEESVRPVLSYLKELGIDIEHRNRAGYSPLARAIQDGTGIEVRVLCELGANVNAVGTRHICGGGRCSLIDSPLIFAAIGAAVEADEKLEAMLRAGARLDVREDEGRSPLQYARDHLDEVQNYETGEYTEDWIREATRCITLLQANASR